MRGVIKDLIGQKFNRLLVIEKIGSNKNKQIEWLCKCDCGKTKVVTSYLLTSGQRRSCGCLHKERLLANTKLLQEKNKKHGDTNTRLYHIWRGIKERCNVKTNKAYKWYGARGIKICDEWNNSYVSFKKWSLANGYDDKLSIDRINNNDDYKPNNCRWTNRITQGSNKSNNRLLTYKGETKTMSEWSRELQIPFYILWNRLHHGWSIENTFEKPIKKKRITR